MKRFLFNIALLGAAAVAVACALFALNGLILAHRESPVVQRTAHPFRALRHTAEGVEVRVVAFNIAKAFAYRQRLRFDSPAAIRGRLDAIAAVVHDADPDLVFLSEVLNECPPCGLSEVQYLAEQTGAALWLFGECYNIGLPFYRLSGGTAILSRIPIDPEINLTLEGRKPFYVSSNNRRALFGRTHIGNAQILVGALHNDSRAGANNVAQMKQILGYIDDRSTLLAGDFNAWSSHPSMALVRDTGRFTRIVDAQGTHPAKTPRRAIDFVLGPSDWRLLEYSVPEVYVSDHRPVVARFVCPSTVCGGESRND